MKEAISSVLDQTFQDVRVLVSDNDSEPAASRQVRQHIEELNDPRVSYYLQAENGGEYGQGRYFMRSLQDESYFMILHDDDRLEPEHIEYGLSKLNTDPELAFFSSSQYLFDERGRTLEEMTEEYCRYQSRDRFPEGRMDDALEILLEYGLFSISGSIFRVSAIREHGLVDDDCTGLYPFEFNVFLRIAERRLPAYYTPRKLSGYRWHNESMRNTDGSTLNLSMVETLIRILEKRHFDGRAERLRKNLLSYNYRNYAFIQYVADNPTGCYQALLRGLRLNPMAPSIWAYLALAVFAPFIIRRRWGPRINLAPPL
ncbi:glycosyltransferase [Thiohalobacter sp. IOR34]|uniref:glycosyltransferase family A protein n=1 Tax=Thiohalobacter sp. IOR34 TaxID=3057176 RepID=UPI0025AFD529|nr:glycosyltransferase family 2 protein [Thiohalobacter sp. IOR34]WJW76306.1 glycosyltransferase [Thiohalobacter sp. IOR34]